VGIIGLVGSFSAALIFCKSLNQSGILGNPRKFAKSSKEWLEKLEKTENM